MDRRFNQTATPPSTGAIGSGITRRVGGASAGLLPLPDPNSTVVSLRRHPQGDIYVTQSPGPGAKLRRVLP